MFCFLVFFFPPPFGKFLFFEHFPLYSVMRSCFLVFKKENILICVYNKVIDLCFWSCISIVTLLWFAFPTKKGCWFVLKLGWYFSRILKYRRWGKFWCIICYMLEKILLHPLLWQFWIPCHSQGKILLILKKISLLHAFHSFTFFSNFIRNNFHW